MYQVSTFDSDTLTTRRREAFSLARKLAKEKGQSELYDCLGIEPPIYFDCEAGKVTICRCTAEARLLRAIFAEAHPASCEEPATDDEGAEL